MIALRLADVAAAVGADLGSAVAEVAITEVTTDSRAATPGSLFVALQGETHDGHDHLDGAYASGAAAALTQRTSDRATDLVVADTWAAIAQLAGHVRRTVAPLTIGITGSVGKTTTKDLAAAACAAGRRTVAARGSFNNEVGVPLTCLSIVADTEVLIAEIGARGLGHIASLMPTVQPDIGIVTRVAGSHLELFDDLATVALAKGELIEALPASGTAVLNADDELVAAMASRTDAAVLLFSADGGSADLRATDIRADALGRASFTAVTPWGSAEVALPLAGRHHISNALAAVAAGALAGVDLQAASGALRTAAMSGRRSEILELNGLVVVNDAYNANATSTIAGIDSLVAIERSGRAWAVLGVMRELGAAHDADHRRVGQHAAASGVDRLIVVGPDARLIAVAARDAGMDHAAVTEVADVETASELVATQVHEGDVVLVKASQSVGLWAIADRLRDELGA